jgi:hydroxyacylglutathione hydrolase
MSISVLPLKMHHQLPHVLMKNFTYLVFDPETREALVIDPTWEMEKIDVALREHQLTLTTILVTHGHGDHTHLVKPLVEKYGCEVRMSEVEAGDFSFACDNLQAIRGEESFQAAHLTVRPLLTPGHTRGCVCYLIGDNLFTGDTLFIEGCGMCFSGTSDPTELFNSLQRLKHGVPPGTRIFPAHSYGFDPGQQFSFVLKYNIYMQFKDATDFTAYRMRSGQTGFFDFK